MSPLHLAALVLAVSPSIDVHEREVAVLETNTVVHADGTERFVQVVAWDEGLDDANRPVPVDRGYKVVRDGYPSVHRCGEDFRVVWWDGPDCVYVLKSKAHLLTETEFDAEARFRRDGGRYRPCW